MKMELLKKRLMPKKLVIPVAMLLLVLVFTFAAQQIMAFFSDVINGAGIVESGCLQVTPTLKIDGQTGNLANVNLPPCGDENSSGSANAGMTGIAVGMNFSCDVVSGRAYCWGLNDSGQLGDGTTTNSSTPVAVNTSGVLAGKTVTAISAGYYSACAIADGKAYCWGNETGTSAGPSDVPVAVDTSVMSGTVTAISAGGAQDDFFCAVADGQAYCWGNNTYGQLGSEDNYYNAGYSATPIAVDTHGANSNSEMSGTVTAISAGGFSTCAIVSGQAYCWGYNNLGQLGNFNNFTSMSVSPVPLAVDINGLNGSEMSGTVTGISVGGIRRSLGGHPYRAGSVCAISDGKAYCWGENGYGQLGNADNYNIGNSYDAGQYSPVPIAVDINGLNGSEMSGTVTSITVNGSGRFPFACAIAAGQAYCWGSNSSGQLGNADNYNNDGVSIVPITVDINGLNGSEMSGTAIAISAGQLSACAIANNRAYCWGDNSVGQLGNADNYNSNPGFSTSLVPIASDIYQTTSTSCDGVPCNGQNQGDSGTVVQPNTIHSFSYTLKNTGTVDYENYTGDKVSAWLSDSSYLPVDHLTFDGASYIDSGILQTTPNLDILTKYQMVRNPSNLQYSMLFGARSGSTINQALLVVNNYAQNTLVFQYGNLNPQVGTAAANLNLNTMSVVTTGTNATAKMTNVNTGVSQSTTATPTAANRPSTPISMFIGAANEGSGMPAAGQLFVGDMYSFSIKSNGVALRDMIPVYDVKNNRCGFFDKVSNQFFGNNGTGTISCVPAPPVPNPMKILLYPASTADSVINSDITALSGSATVAPNAIATINGSSCSDTFYGTDAGITPVCSTSILPNTLGVQTAVGNSQSYDYKFVVYIPSSVTANLLSGTKVYFGVSSGAKNVIPINAGMGEWKQQVHPYINTKTSLGNVPTYTIGSSQPFVDQVVADSVTPNLAQNEITTTNYLQGLVKATDNEDGTCTFGATGCTIALTDNGGFDPSTVGTYNVKYSIADSNGNMVKVTVPVKVWNFVKIVNGQYHVLALGSNGSVWTFGYNSNGQRGVGTGTASSLNGGSPTQIKQSYFGDQSVVDIAAAQNTSCAINSVGKAYCWGASANGALGGTATDQSYPVAVTMPVSSVTFTQISGSGGTDASGVFGALGSDGNIYTWGNNDSFRLGNGSMAGSQSTPSAITSSGDFVQVRQGNMGGVAINSAGQAYVWGDNNYGQLAIGTSGAVNASGGANATNSKPHLVSGLSNIKQVSYGGYGTLGFVVALTSSGQVYGWGYNEYSRLGFGSNSPLNVTTPTPSPLVSNVDRISTGVDFTQFITGNNIQTVGYQDYGEGFAGITTANNQSPVQSVFPNIAGNVGMAAGGYSNSWILSPNGKMVWGIGYSNATDREFGNNTSAGAAASTAAAVAWTFVPNPMP